MAGDMGRSLDAEMVALRLRGGAEVIDGKEFVRKPILDEVTAEVIERTWRT